MKTPWMMAALFFTVMPVLGERLPDNSAGEVTLGWQKFNDLWTKMQEMEKKIQDLEKPENLPPIPFTITKAAYKGAVGEKRTDITAIFELDVYDPKEWVKIPFLPSSVAITDAELNGKPVGVVQENGFHAILLKKPGRYTLRTRFSLRSPKPEEAPQLSFALQNTPITVMALEFARPNLDVQIDPAQGVETQAIGTSKTLVTAALPPTNYITVRWQKAVPEEVAGPAKLYLDSQNLISVSEGTLKARWNLNYSILRKGVRELRVGVPEGWNILAVNAEGLQEWKMQETPQGTVLRIQLAYARRGTLDVGIQMERALSDKDEVVEIPQVKAFDIEREQGTIGVEAKGAIEVDVQTAEGLQRLDPRELPGGLWQGATQPILLAFRYTKAHALALAVKRHPETPVLTTTVDDANAMTVLTERGQVITKVRYQVRNQLKQYLAIALPQGAELWSAFVAGEPVKPMKAEDGRYRIPLAKSQLGDQGQSGFPVELIFYRASAKFYPLGYKSMTLPMPDAPVSRMLWSVYLPEKYRFPYFGGDVEKGASARPWNALVAANAVYRNDAPALFERGNRKALKSEMAELAGRITSSGSDSRLEQIVDKQTELASKILQNAAPASAVAGVFPVSFDLPASGQLFHFGQVMVVGQAPHLTLGYLHRGFVQAAMALFLGFLFMGIYRFRNLWQPLTFGLAKAIRVRIIQPARN